jgi:hypothetical protein
VIQVARCCALATFSKPQYIVEAQEIQPYVESINRRAIIAYILSNKASSKSSAAVLCRSPPASPRVFQRPEKNFVPAGQFRKLTSGWHKVESGGDFADNSQAGENNNPALDASGRDLRHWRGGMPAETARRSGALIVAAVGEQTRAVGQPGEMMVGVAE